jgi:hypothetical protein
VKTGTAIIPAASVVTETPAVDDESQVLDGFFLVINKNVVSKMILYSAE